MVEGGALIFWITAGVVFLIIEIIKRHERRKYPNDSAGPETGDGMNPEALRDWRKANWRMEK